jgi:hypothetical protein
VRPDISERILGHAIAGVEGVYDQHSYLEQKAQALKMLAGLIDEIVSGTSRVVKMRATRCSEPDEWKNARTKTR